MEQNDFIKFKESMKEIIVFYIEKSNSIKDVNLKMGSMIVLEQFIDELLYNTKNNLIISGISSNENWKEFENKGKLIYEEIKKELGLNIKIIVKKKEETENE